MALFCHGWRYRHTPWYCPHLKLLLHQCNNQHSILHIMSILCTINRCCQSGANYPKSQNNPVNTNRSMNCFSLERRFGTFSSGPNPPLRCGGPDAWTSFKRETNKLSSDTRFNNRTEMTTETRSTKHKVQGLGRQETILYPYYIHIVKQSEENSPLFFYVTGFFSFRWRSWPGIWTRMLTERSTLKIFATGCSPSRVRLFSLYRCKAKFCLLHHTVHTL